MSSRVKITRATHALFFEAPTSNNHNDNNKLLNFFKTNFSVEHAYCQYRDFDWFNKIFFLRYG